MTKKRGEVVALVGAQLGSEGKGVVSHLLAKEFEVCVRTGAPNAGHSFVEDGKLYKMQTIPCTWPNRDGVCVLGAGALINEKIFKRELQMVREVDPSIDQRLYVDPNAGILEEKHHEEEGGVQGEMHRRIGSTGEGVGPARRDRIMRDPAHFMLARDAQWLKPFLIDTVDFLHKAILDGHDVLLEGTQGSGLSLIHGSWPHVTSADTNAAQMAADAGIPPQWVTDTILVARTYPIRVAGASGPLKGEISWDDLSVRIGKKVVEFTTVTKKQRRIGEWDEAMFTKAIKLNAPSMVALTFLDYLVPEDAGKTSFSKLSGKSMDFIHYLERTFGVKVQLIGTGFDEYNGWKHIDRRER